jgi:hypothetical protein
MKNILQMMAEDIQQRIRQVAYLMWESAGRQQGMAMDYWLAAEREVLSTMQAATERLMPAETKGAPAAPKPAAEPAAPAPQPTAAAAAPELPPAPAPAPAPAPTKPAARKSAAPKPRAKTAD